MITGTFIPDGRNGNNNAVRKCGGTNFRKVFYFGVVSDVLNKAGSEISVL